MKYLLSAGIALFCMACSMQRSIKRDIDTVIKFAPGSFAPDNKEELLATSHRGYALYTTVCTGSGCHGATDRGTDTIPHFNMLELDNYEKAAKSNDPDNHAVTAKLSPEQLSDILSFLFLRTLAHQAEEQQAGDKSSR